jgi:hypothetical protein
MGLKVGVTTSPIYDSKSYPPTQSQNLLFM